MFRCSFKSCLMLSTPGDLLTWNFTFYTKLNLISDRIIWNVKLPTSALQFSRTSARNRETHGIENAARRSPITIASEIYRFTVADNSILFLSSSFPVLFSESIDLYVGVGSEMYRALQFRISTRCHAKCNAHAMQERAAAVTLFVSTRTSIPPDKGINRITSTGERISAPEMECAYACADTGI